MDGCQACLRLGCMWLIPHSRRAAATTFLTIRNLSGTAGELVAARSPIARQVVLTVRNGPVGPMTVVSDLAIPAHASLTLSSTGDDVVLRDRRRWRPPSACPSP